MLHKACAGELKQCAHNSWMVTCSNVEADGNVDVGVPHLHGQYHAAQHMGTGAIWSAQIVDLDILAMGNGAHRHWPIILAKSGVGHVVVSQLRPAT